MVGQMIKVGESTGNLDLMLLKVADVFEEEVGNLIGTMTKLIEPAIIVVLGGTVAIILGAMYMPVFEAAGGMFSHADGTNLIYQTPGYSQSGCLIASHGKSHGQICQKAMEFFSLNEPKYIV